MSMPRTDALTTTCKICGETLIVNVIREAADPGRPLPEEQAEESLQQARKDHNREAHPGI